VNERTPERRNIRLSDEEFERIAIRASVILEERFAASAGRWFIRKVLQVGGTILFALTILGTAIGYWKEAEPVLKILRGH
jgi:hypothetical protein